MRKLTPFLIILSLLSPLITSAVETDIVLSESASPAVVDSEQAIFIEDTAIVDPDSVVLGRVTIANATMIFKGQFQFPPDSSPEAVPLIIWHTVNEKTFKPTFTSNLIAARDLIIAGTELIITGYFDDLVNQLFPDAATLLASNTEESLDEEGVTESPELGPGEDSDIEENSVNDMMATAAGTVITDSDTETVSEDSSTNDNEVTNEKNSEEDTDESSDASNTDNQNGDDSAPDTPDEAIDSQDQISNDAGAINNESSVTDNATDNQDESAINNENDVDDDVDTDESDIESDTGSQNEDDTDSDTPDDMADSDDQISDTPGEINDESTITDDAVDSHDESAINEGNDTAETSENSSPSTDNSSDNDVASSENDSGDQASDIEDDPDNAVTTVDNNPVTDDETDSISTTDGTDTGDESDNAVTAPSGDDLGDTTNDLEADSASNGNINDSGGSSSDINAGENIVDPDDTTVSGSNTDNPSQDDGETSDIDSVPDPAADEAVPVMGESDVTTDNDDPGADTNDPNSDNPSTDIDTDDPSLTESDVSSELNSGDSGENDDANDADGSSNISDTTADDVPVSGDDDDFSTIGEDQYAPGEDAEEDFTNEIPTPNNEVDNDGNEDTNEDDPTADENDDASAEGSDNDSSPEDITDNSEEITYEGNETTDDSNDDDTPGNNDSSTESGYDPGNSDSADDIGSIPNEGDSTVVDTGTEDTVADANNPDDGLSDLDEDNYAPADSDNDNQEGVVSTDAPGPEDDGDSEYNDDEDSSSSDEALDVNDDSTVESGTPSDTVDDSNYDDTGDSGSDDDYIEPDTLSGDDTTDMGGDTSGDEGEPDESVDDGFSDLDDDNYSPDSSGDDANDSDQSDVGDFSEEGEPDNEDPSSPAENNTVSTDDSGESTSEDDGNSNDMGYGNDADDIASGGTTTETTPTNDSDSVSTSADDANDAVTVSSVDTADCDPVVNYDTGSITFQTKTVTSYSDGSTSETACVNSRVYGLIARYDDCSVRNDFVAGLSYLRQKIGYLSDSCDFVTLKGCHDTTTAYPHLKTSGSCSQYYDSDTDRIYDAKKTYYVDASGTMVFITDCQIDSASYSTVSPADYLREYSDSDEVDLTSLRAYKRYRNYVKLNDSTVTVSGWLSDTSNPMTVYRDYDDCGYAHDLSAGFSYRQFKYAYDRDGETRTVSSTCQKDTDTPYPHITDSRFCAPRAVDRTLYNQVSTYFLDTNGSRVVVDNCSMTNQLYIADSEDIIRDYDDCAPRIDYDAMLAYASYVEKFAYGNTSTTISSCVEDKSVYYPLKTTYEGCSYRIDTQAGRAYLQSRLYYNKGDANVYVSDCADSDISAQLQWSTDACTPKVSGDALTQYQQTYYINNSGDKVIVQNCTATDQVLPITEDVKLYDYDSCGVQIDLDTLKAYKKYQTYVEISGERTLLKSCQMDYNRSYDITQTTDGCDIRHDFTGGVSYVRARQIYLDDAGNDMEVTSCFDTAKSYPHKKMVDACAPTYDSATNAVYDTKKTYYVDDAGNINFITGCLIDSSSATALTSDDIKIEYLLSDYVDYPAGYAYKRFREYITLSDETKQYVSAVKIDDTHPMEIVRDYSECDYYNDTIAGLSYPRYAGVYYRDGVRKVVSSCQADKSISFTHITDSKYCAPLVNNMTAFEKVSTYFLNESNTRVVVTDCELNGNEQTISADEIEKDYDSCSPKIDYANLTVYERFKEYVTYNSTVSYLSECQIDTDLTYPITLTSDGCSYRIDTDNKKAIQQKRYYYSNGSNPIYITACADSPDTYPFISSPDNCEPGVSADGLYFIDKAETYFIDATAMRHVVTECSATGTTTLIPASLKYKDFSNCAPEVSIIDMLAYGRYQLFVDNGADDVMIQDCAVDESVTYAIQEDFASCGVTVDKVSNVANQYHKLYYSTGDSDVYVSSCVTSDITYPIRETTNGCAYSVDLENHVAIQRKRTYYKDNSGVINYLSDCADTDVESEILTSTEGCEQLLADDGLHLNEMAESYYLDSDGQKVVARSCAATGNTSELPETAYSRNYENCAYLLSLDTGVAYLQYQTYVTYGDTSFMVKACQPDYETPYTLHQDFSGCSPKIDLVQGTVTETAEWYFRQGTDDTRVTDCIETDTTYPALSRTDICEVLEIDNDPSNVIEQSILYYVDSNNNIQYISECQPTSNMMAVTTEITQDRYIHNNVAGESYIEVVSKHGDQVVSSPYASPNHAAMPHLTASCGWTNDDTNYRSTYNARTYITDVITGATIYLDECHPSNQFISYSYTGSSTYDNNDGGHSGSCSAGLYWYGSIPVDGSRWCNHANSWPYTQSSLSLHGNEFSARSGLNSWISRYKSVFHNYSRPDGSIYQKWWKNYCGVYDATIATASEYNGDLCGSVSGEANAVRVLSQWYGSANNFGNLRLSYTPSD